MNLMKTVLLSVLCLTALSSLAAADPLRGLSKPSHDVVLSFVRPGMIARAAVKEGDVVKAGDVLVEQDNLAEKLTLEQLKAQAEDIIRIDAAKAQLDQKKVDLKKLEEAAKLKAATVLEVEHAVLDVRIAELSLDLAKFEKAQAERKYKEMAEQVARMQIRSPIDGKIERLLKKQGESVDALDPVLRVVNTDTLWIDVPTPPAVVCKLQCGQQAELDFPCDSQADPKQVCKGKIIFIPAVNDGASNTCLVRVEAPNVFKRRAGEHVMVNFQLEPAQASADGGPATRPALASPASADATR